MHSSRSAGGASVSTCTLGSSSALPALGKRPRAEMRRYNPAATAWVCPEAMAVGNSIIIELEENKKVSRLNRAEGLFDGSLGQWCHDLESRRVGMQPVIGQIFLQITLLIHHAGEVVEVGTAVR